jgi:hypothetical protein
MLPPTRTQSEWIPSPLVCRAWNVPRPKPSESRVHEGGVAGKDLLAMPASQRAGAYAGALPDFMRPPAQSAGCEIPSVQPLLPPPPPRGHDIAHSVTHAQAAKDQLDQAAEELLASIQADMVGEVEQVRV